MSLVSVVIPAYNVAPWLPLLFEGLNVQTFHDFETIFVNDGSTDKTGALLDAYASSREGVRVIHQSNGGISAARNAGVDAASGTYIAFIDGDDTVGPSYLADLVSLAISLDLDLAMCNGWRFREKPGDMTDHPLVSHPKPQGVMSGLEWFEATLEDGECFTAWTTMVRREFLLRHKIRFMEGVCMEDLLWSAMGKSKAKRVAYTPQRNYYYRWAPGSIMNDASLGGKLRRIESYMIVIEELWRIAESETPRVSALFNRLGAALGRVLLGQIAKTGTLRQRIAILSELRKRGFLARLFRETKDIAHRKRIVRACGYGMLGLFADRTFWPASPK